ncbi:hypothetical protein MUB15_25195 [Priestia sp. OVS21]|nr:hypothetical protein [Priestia sp. OVS21]
MQEVQMYQIKEVTEKDAEVIQFVMNMRNELFPMMEKISFLWICFILMNIMFKRKALLFCSCHGKSTSNWNNWFIRLRWKVSCIKKAI